MYAIVTNHTQTNVIIQQYLVTTICVYISLVNHR